MDKADLLYGNTDFLELLQKQYSDSAPLPQLLVYEKDDSDEVEEDPENQFPMGSFFS